MSNLQEIVELLKEYFPRVKDKTLIKIVFTIKARDSQFKTIWLSRYEANKFWVWETTLQKIINFLKEFWILEFAWTRLRNKWTHICNYYLLSEDFKSLFSSLKMFIKKTFEYIDPIVFMKRFLSYTYDTSTKTYKFKVNWNRYIIKTTWRFKWKIYWIEENKIINPLTLIT